MNTPPVTLSKSARIRNIINRFGIDQPIREIIREVKKEIQCSDRLIRDVVINLSNPPKVNKPQNHIDHSRITQLTTNHDTPPQIVHESQKIESQKINLVQIIRAAKQLVSLVGNKNDTIDIIKEL